VIKFRARRGEGKEIFGLAQKELIIDNRLKKARKL